MSHRSAWSVPRHVKKIQVFASRLLLLESFRITHTVGGVDAMLGDKTQDSYYLTYSKVGFGMDDKVELGGLDVHTGDSGREYPIFAET